MDRDWERPSAASLECAAANNLGHISEALIGVQSAEQIEDVCMTLIPSVLPSKAFGIYLFKGANREAPVRSAQGVSDRFLALYEESGRERDPVLHAASDTIKPAHSSYLMRQDEWLELPVFREVLALHDMRMVCEAPITNGREVYGTLNFADRDPMTLSSPFELAMAGALGRLVGLAVASLVQRQDLERERDFLIDALELADEAMVITDLVTGARRMNRAALDVLRAVGPEQPAVWLEDLFAAARSPGKGLCQFFTVDVDVRGERRRLTLRTTTSSESGRELMVSVLQLSAPVGSQKVLPPTVASALSAREREIASYAVTGLHDHEISERLFLSRYTVKQHLKSVYRKLGIRSRLDLTRVVLGGEHSGDREEP